MAKSQANNKKRKAEEPESPDVSSESEEEGMHVVGEGDESSSDEASDEEVEEVAPDETEFAVASGVDKDSKLDEKQNIGAAMNEIASVKSCNSAILLECRKRQDCYMWVGLTPNGPSAKFHLSNVHTLDELKMTGNCMKGSRPLLSFDASFKDPDQPHLGLIKELFTEIFGTPRGHPKSKPFIDRVMSFYVADGRIWVRNYQIVEEEAQNAKEARDKKLELGLDTSLVEIGPRFVLNPMRIFAGSFSGQTLYTNPDFVSPNAIRSMEQKGKGVQYESRKQQQKDRKQRKTTIEKSKRKDPLADIFK
ncbi:hypothetical protein TrRE_jg9986 [Triparma retinervis]|uniref:Brix domain-containing protein n=1 Tax=Triparma retinervis TaxID=2557542 RepID=A0A9W7L858_9STRA|nr:hypothetical protein TrRE_jg9986 [Triparma retinervis]